MTPTNSTPGIEQEEILAGSRLIAEFMSFRKYLDDPKFIESDLITYHKYHSSWDWLMPVVEKIEGMGVGFTIDGNADSGIVTHGVEDDRWPWIEDFNPFYVTDADTKIGSIWELCIKFIKFHNSQTQTNDTTK